MLLEDGMSRLRVVGACQGGAQGGGFFNGVSQGGGGWGGVNFIQGFKFFPDWGSIVTFSGDDIVGLRVLFCVVEAVRFLSRFSTWLDFEDPASHGSDTLKETG